jgi:hypothetical protein
VKTALDVQRLQLELQLAWSACTDFGACVWTRCDAPYCYQHRNISSSGLGTCPSGHDKSLDPHWSPEWLPACPYPALSKYRSN